MKRIVGIILLIVIQISIIRANNVFAQSRDSYLNEPENLKTVIRKPRQADASNPLNQGTDRLRNEIANFSESIKGNSFRPSFIRPNSNFKITNLENEIKKVKEEIEQLKNAPNVDSSSKTKFNSLAVAIETLQKLFDDRNRGSSSQIEILESTVDSLTASLTAYSGELEKLKKLIDEKDREESERLKPAEIAQDIKDREYANAFEKLRNLPGDFRKNADHVVRAANLDQGSNLARLRDFAFSFYNEPEMALKFYQSLGEEMENIHFNDPLEMFKLVKSLNYALLGYQPGDPVPPRVKSSAKNLADRLQSTARDLASRKFEDAMIADSYRSLSDLANEIVAEDPLSFGEIMKKVMSKVINRIDAEKLVNFMKEHEYISQRIFGYSAIFNELKSKNRMDDPAIVFLAYGLKNVMEMNTYQYTLSAASTAAEEVKAGLPRSVRNLAFSKRVCIKNRSLGEYLSTGDYQSFDESRRRVSTYTTGSRVYRDQWIVYPVEYVFFIKSYVEGYKNEYLYAADDNHKMDLSRRRVLTWMPGDRVKQGRWLIEPSGDDVYIKNQIHNEYLYADSIIHKKDRTVFTWGSGSKPSNSLWTIEECNVARLP